MRVYVDLVILLNFAVDLLLLLGANRIFGYPPGILRVAFGAALGGLYGGACCLPGFRFLGNWIWRMVFLGLIGTTAYGFGRSAWKRTGAFALLSMALGGIALAIGRGGIGVTVLAATCLWIFCRIGFRGGPVTGCFVPLKITHRGITLRLTALRDSGNCLRDPVTGEQVLVIGCDAAQMLTGLEPLQLRTPLETMQEHALPGLRLIPYRAVGQPGGMLLAMKFKDVVVGDRCGAAVVAFAPDRIGMGEGYQALTGGTI